MVSSMCPTLLGCSEVDLFRDLSLWDSLLFVLVSDMYFHTPTTRVFFTQSIRLVHQLIAARHNDANGFRVDPSLYPTDVGTTPCS